MEENMENEMEIRSYGLKGWPQCRAQVVCADYVPNTKP